jgi:hypothetical protein
MLPANILILDFDMPVRRGEEEEVEKGTLT